MKQHQKGEAMIAVMVVVVIVMWISNSGHMGMMGMMHGGDHTDKSETSAAQTKAKPAQLTASKESTEHQH